MKEQRRFGCRESQGTSPGGYLGTFRSSDRRSQRSSTVVSVFVLILGCICAVNRDTRGFVPGPGDIVPMQAGRGLRMMAPRVESTRSGTSSTIECVSASHATSARHNGNTSITTASNNNSNNNNNANSSNNNVKLEPGTCISFVSL